MLPIFSPLSFITLSPISLLARKPSSTVSTLTATIATGCCAKTGCGRDVAKAAAANAIANPRLAQIVLRDAFIPDSFESGRRPYQAAAMWIFTPINLVAEDATRLDGNHFSCVGLNRRFFIADRVLTQDGARARERRRTDRSFLG